MPIEERKEDLYVRVEKASAKLQREREGGEGRAEGGRSDEGEQEGVHDVESWERDWAGARRTAGVLGSVQRELREVKRG